MDFRLGPDHRAFRSEARKMIERVVTPRMRARAKETGSYVDWDLHRELAKRGWIGDDYPVELGGGGRDPMRMVLLYEELQLADAPFFGWTYARNNVNILRHTGSEHQKKELIPRLLAGEILICFGYSEPECGSDVAAVRTRAVRSSGGWTINGQKMFTSIAESASMVFLLARTNLDVPKHKGLSLFLVPLDAPGVEIRELKTLGGERTNVTFYDDVLVGDDALVGAVDGGWQVMAAALREERPGGTRDIKDRLLLNAVAAAQEDPSRPLSNAVARETLARIAVENEVAKLLGYRASWLFGEGRPSAIEGSMFKLFSSESLTRSASAVMDLFGNRGILQTGEHLAPASGTIEQVYRHSHVETIYAGTSEIQRGIIAQHRLGLPRSR